MSIIIEIKSPTIQEITGTAKSGKPYHIRKQVGWAYTYDQAGQMNPYPERIEMQVGEGQEAFPVGRYTLAPQSFYVGDFNSLAIGRPVLLPYKAA